jgi:hypothetical protein
VPVIDRAFGQLLHAAASVEVMTEAMRDRYHTRYSVDSVISNRGIPSVCTELAPYDLSRGLRIAVFGTTYGAHDALEALAGAVTAAGRALGVPAELLIIGGHPLRLDRAPTLRLTHLGHLTEPEAVQALRTAFLLYLGYPFGARDSVLRQTSFPIKLCTYLAACRPLLVHAAPDASTYSLGDFPEFVVRWPNLNLAEGAAALAAFFCRAFNPKDGAAAEAIRRRHFDVLAHRSTTFGALNKLVSSPQD